MSEPPGLPPVTLSLFQPLDQTEEETVMETYKERNIKERNIKKWNNKDNQVNKDNDENVGYGFPGEEGPDDNVIWEEDNGDFPQEQSACQAEVQEKRPGWPEQENL